MMFDLMLRSYPLLLQGCVLTLKVLVCAGFGSFSLGTIMGILMAMRVKILAKVIEAVTFVLRAVPFYVQLLLAYFVIPDLLGFDLDPFIAAVLALALCSSGYVAQIVRGAMQTIPVSQWEAAEVLGFSRWQSLYYVIIPQMIRNALPSFNNEMDALLKSTAIVSSIGLLELTRMGMNIVSREMEPIPIYLMVALFYVLMSAVLNLASRTLETYVKY